MPTPQSFVWATALTKKETTFAGGFATDGVYSEWIAGLNADFVVNTPEYVDNSEEINGSVGAPTEHILMMKQGALSREFQCSVETLTAFLAWALGNVSSAGSADPWTHSISWPLPCSNNPPSFSFVELLNCAGFTSTFYKYKGATVESVAVDISSKGYIKLTVSIKTDGSETAAASFTVPTSYKTVQKVLGNMVTLKYGPLGTETISSIRGVKFTVALGLTIPSDISTSTTVPEFQFKKGGPTIDSIEFTAKGDKSHAVYGYHQAKTACILVLLIDAGVTPLRSVQLTASQTICRAEVKPQGNETNIVVHVMAEANATDGSAANPRPARFVCKNGVAAYNVAA